jgi:hypothetical protein
MKNIIRTLIVISAISLFVKDGYADKDRSLGIHKTTAPASVNKGKAEACTPATGSMDLDLNNVRARINTGGDMWWDLQNVSEYYIPANTKKTCMFSGSLWIAGIDVNGQLKCAALRYRQQGNDYWPGPLTTDGTASIDAATCKQYDKHFKITRNEVNEFLSHCDPVDGHFVGAAGYTIPNSIKDWPGNGDVSKGQSQFLAPFHDNINNADGIYNPLDGDYPYYDLDNSLCPKNLPLGTDPQGTPEFFGSGPKNGGILADEVLKGDETLWWVFNDKGNVHTETGGQAIGLEIRAQAFAFSTNDEINNMTFYSYEIINRSTYKLTETYFSQWVDTDLGYAYDDFVGCDVKRGLGYCYNGKAIDGNGEASSYGAQPPAVGVDFFQGPYMDPDGMDNTAGLCDVGINGVNFGNHRIDDERFGMRKFVYHNNTGGGGNQAITDPEIAPQYYNLLRGIWKDGVHMMWGGNAHPSSGSCGPECDFMFPGDTDPCYWGTNGAQPNCMPYWTEETAGNTPYDRRFMQSAGPFTLQPGAVNYITVGIPWARAASGGPFASVELLRQVDDKCQKLFDNCFKVVDGPDAPDLTIQELDKELILYLTNDTVKGVSNNRKERYQEYDPNIVSPDTLVGANRYDSTYKFEGYQIFQLKDATVSIADIHDPDKARIVAQCDIKNYDKDGNAIGDLVNYYYDETTGGNKPVLEVQGANTGIIHSFRILSDQFATGDQRLVNHKQYYYIAIAYAYNNYLKYSQDAGVLNGLNGQKKPYLAGRKSSTGTITPVTGIPHNPSPEANGTIMNAAYGSGPKITRVEGQGNGGMNLDLTSATVDKILSGSPDKSLEYENNMGPIDVRVIDPLNVKNGSFTLKFTNVPYTNYKSLYKAKWELVNNDDGRVYYSDTTLEVGDEKILLDLGLSVTIKQVEKGGDSLSPNYGFIESTIQYADSSQQWLGGVPDEDAGYGFSFNWIRSGTMCDNQVASNCDYDLVPGVSGNCVGSKLDPNKYYTKILGGTFAPYRLASKYENGPAYPLYFSLNKIENICSVDLVICPNDPSKWTRCPVIEECEDKNSALSEGNAKKFDLRKGQSMKINGNSYFDLTPDPAGGTGMSWFPGYAINVETGERLNMMFGEDSWLIGENGRDMKWIPTSNLATNIYYSSIGTSIENSQILFGGKHYIYILGHHADSPDDCPAYDQGAWLQAQLTASNKKNVYSDVIWTGIPLANTKPWLSNDVKIRIRVMKPYNKNYATTGSSSPLNNNYPMYTFSTSDIATTYGDLPTAKSALDLINIVPNPYYAYSSYETSQLDNRVKITNLPEKCTISIYTVNGTLIRQFTKDETKTSFDWDLKNFAGIPISGGIYLIHIKADGIGEKVIKWFGVLRPIDLNAF